MSHKHNTYLFCVTKVNDAFNDHVTDLAVDWHSLEFSCVNMFHVLIFVKILHAPLGQHNSCVQHQEGQEER